MRMMRGREVGIRLAVLRVVMLPRLELMAGGVVMLLAFKVRQFMLRRRGRRADAADGFAFF
jgi:hypothetical protein